MGAAGPDGLAALVESKFIHARRPPAPIQGIQLRTLVVARSEDVHCVYLEALLRLPEDCATQHFIVWNKELGSSSAKVFSPLAPTSR